MTDESSHSAVRKVLHFFFFFDTCLFYAADASTYRYALSYLNGTRDQHWHRDTGLLFAHDDDFHLPDAHARIGGLHEPPYALNVFIPLADVEVGSCVGSLLWFKMVAACNYVPQTQLPSTTLLSSSICCHSAITVVIQSCILLVGRAGTGWTHRIHFGESHVGSDLVGR